MRQFQTLWTLKLGCRQPVRLNMSTHYAPTKQQLLYILSRGFSALSLSGAFWPSHFFPPLLSSLAPATTPSPFQAGWVLGLHVDIW